LFLNREDIPYMPFVPERSYWMADLFSYMKF